MLGLLTLWALVGHDGLNVRPLSGFKPAYLQVALANPRGTRLAAVGIQPAATASAALPSPGQHGQGSDAVPSLSEHAAHNGRAQAEPPQKMHGLSLKPPTSNAKLLCNAATDGPCAGSRVPS